VAAGNAQQVATLVGTKGVLAMVITQMASGEWDVRKEAAWVVSNVATGGAAAHIGQLVECGAVRPLCDLLGVGDNRMVEIALDALEAVLRVGEATGQDFVTLLHEAEGPERLEKLQEHANERIYQRSVQLIERYLGVENENEEGGVAGAAGAAGGQENSSRYANGNSNGTFGFSVQPQQQPPAHPHPHAYPAAGAPAAVVGAGGGFNFAGVPRTG
jgi:importin subunit alpha-6/7